jgi:hypothetical protein
MTSDSPYQVILVILTTDSCLDGDIALYHAFGGNASNAREHHMRDAGKSKQPLALDQAFTLLNHQVV